MKFAVVLVLLVGLAACAPSVDNVNSDSEKSRRQLESKSLKEERQKEETRREIKQLEKEETRREIKQLEREKDEERREAKKEMVKTAERRATEQLDKERREVEQLEKERRDVASGAGEFRWESIPIAENASQCIYSPETRALACRGANGLVECPAQLDIPSDMRVEVFGLRRHPVKSVVADIPSRVYELYPRKLDNTTYLNFTRTVGNETVELYLYYGETRVAERSGVRVTERRCFRRLVNVVLEQAKAEHEVSVEGSQLRVDLMGEILNADKPNNKRWLGLGLGLGLGFPWMFGGLGMWGWGLGWGLPFWG